MCDAACTKTQQHKFDFVSLILKRYAAKCILPIRRRLYFVVKNSHRLSCTYVEECRRVFDSNLILKCLALALTLRL